MGSHENAVKSDDELRRAVEQQLEAEPDLDARRIVVSVDDGIVTLAGEVRSFGERWQTERLIDRIPGVRGVANEIEVHSDTTRSDSDIARMAVRALRRSLLAPSGSVTVRVEHGWVVLTGEVGWDFQRRAAERAVRNVPAVRGISNLVTVRPRAGSRDVDSR
jgi:osmotically-inducible protein OsmY